MYAYIIQVARQLFHRVCMYKSCVDIAHCTYHLLVIVVYRHHSDYQ